MDKAYTIAGRSILVATSASTKQSCAAAMQSSGDELEETVPSVFVVHPKEKVLRKAVVVRE